VGPGGTRRRSSSDGVAAREAFEHDVVLVLVVLDLCPLRRRPVRVVEKLPFLLLGLAVAAVAGPGLDGPDAQGLERGLRRARAVAYGLAFYARKTLWPTRLAALYELPYALDPLESRFVSCYAGVAVALAAILLLRRRVPSLAAGAAAYVALLLPTLGLAHAGPQLAADRYSYLGCLPIAVLAGGAIFFAFTTRATAARWIAGVGSIAAIALLFGLARKQTATWHDDASLWSHAIAVGHPSSVAHSNLGVLDAKAGRDEAAIEHFRAALALRPDNGPAWLNLGHLDARGGRLAKAEDEYVEACRTMPSPTPGPRTSRSRASTSVRFEPERAVEPLRRARSNRRSARAARTSRRRRTSSSARCSWSSVARVSRDPTSRPRRASRRPRPGSRSSRTLADRRLGAGAALAVRQRRLVRSSSSFGDRRRSLSSST
jgi:tetratricopeptide (TPR) repeat protein